MKTLPNSDVSGARQNVKDIKIVGNGDMFSLLCKTSSEVEGWVKSTKAMEIPSIGCVVQVTTQQRNIDGNYVVAEALTFVPDARIVSDENGGRRLVHELWVPGEHQGSHQHRQGPIEDRSAFDTLPDDYETGDY